MVKRLETEGPTNIDPEEDEGEYLKDLIDECGTDYETEESPKPDARRPPSGESSVPDGKGESDPKVAKGIEALKKEATSLHHLMTHVPKNPYCSVCNQAKMYKTPGYKTEGLRSVEASSFGDHITADHVVIYRDNDSVVEEARLALVIKDVATNFMYAYPSALKDADECKASLQHFVASKDKVGVFYSDNAKELTKASKSLGWRHEHSKEYVHQSNADAVPSDEQKAEIEDASRKVEQAMVIDPQSGRYGGARGSTKPDEIPSHLWVNMSKAQKKKAIEESAMKAALELTETRHTIIMPLGGSTIVNDEDDWKNRRRRNKKLRFKWIGQTTFEIKPSLHPTPSGDGSYPSMPVVAATEDEHRDKLQKHPPLTEEEIRDAMSMVARPVGRKELNQNPKAQASLDVEWEKLMKKQAWDMGSVREWDSVSSEALKRNRKVHVGKIFEICVEKGSELPANDPLRKFKGRTVFQGNNVKDESNDTALFSELGSSPATMEAGKTLDAYGHMPGNVCEQADGKQAYTQTKLKGAETWVRLPKERWPKGRYLGCEHLSQSTSLGKADHPFAHVFDKSIPDPAAKPATAAAVQDYSEYYPEDGVVVRHHLQPRKAYYSLKPEEAQALNVGKSRLTEVTSLAFPEVVEEVWDDKVSSRKRGELWTGRTYLVSEQLNRTAAMAAINRVRDKTKAKKAARKQAFYDVNQLDKGQGCMKSPTRQVIYDMSSFLQQAIDRYKELTPSEFHNLKKVSTPFYDDKIARPVGTEAEVRGKLAPIASRVLMKLLFAARLMCYVHSTLHYKMSGFVGDSIDKCNLWLFA
ncbi:unnamed protein product, partial [Symbiodinium sp. CCMP2456]